MRELDRRSMLAGLAAVGGVAVAGCSESDSGPNGNQTSPGGQNGQNGQTERTILERTIAPGSDGNPATVTLDANPGEVLSIDTTYEQAAVLDLFGGDSGVSVATGGTGLVHEQASQLRSDPLPEGDAQPTLAVAMHPEDRVDLTVTAVGQGEPTAPTSPGATLRDQIGAVSQTFSQETSSDDGLRVAGPLWLRLFDQKLQMVSGGTSGARTELSTAQEAVYGSLVREQTTTWVGEQIEQVASFLASATVSLVSLKTGLPAGLLEGTLQSELENVLEGDTVMWSYGEPEAQSLSPTGGSVSLVATADIELSIEGFGVRIEAPLELLGSANGEQIPASATIDEFNVLQEQAVVELL
jgi:hypothetical protein